MDSLSAHMLPQLKTMVTYIPFSTASMEPCAPNLTAVADHGMPSGTGRKGGVGKRKRNRKTPTIESRSVRPCLQQSPLSTPKTLSPTWSTVVPVGAPRVSVPYSFGSICFSSHALSNHAFLTSNAHLYTSVRASADTLSLYAGASSNSSCAPSLVTSGLQGAFVSPVGVLQLMAPVFQVPALLLASLFLVEM